MEDGCDDPVVREIDVFINRLDQESDFYLLQYPLRPVYRPYGDHGQLYKIKRRPESKRLELTYALNVDGPQFGEAAKSLISSMLAQQADGKLSAKDQAELDSLRFHRLQSSAASNDQGCEYGLGFMRNGRFYVTPAARLLQFRPDFSHIDRAAELAKARAVEVTAAHGGDTPSTEVVGTSEEAKLEYGLESRLKIGHAAQKAKEDNELYEDVDCFFDPDSPETAEITNLLSTFPIKYATEVQEDFGGMGDLLTGGARDLGDDLITRMEVKTKRVQVDEKIPQIISDKRHVEYLDCLCAGCSSSLLAGTKVASGGDDKAAGVGTGPLSYLALSKLSLQEQVKQILRVRQMETFSNIKSTLTSKSITDAELILLLQSPGVGVPLNGVWVALSDLIYPEVISRWTEIEKAFRNAILCFLSMGMVPPRDKIRALTGCPPDIMNRVMAALCVSKDGKIVPKVPADREFEEKYERICSAAKEQWGKVKASECAKTLKDLMQLELNRQRGGGGSGSKLEDLDPARIKRLVIQYLREKGASAEAQILDRVKLVVSKEVEIEHHSAMKQVKEKKANNTVELSQLTQKFERVAKSIETLASSDLQTVLLDVGQSFMDLWTLKNSGDTKKDQYRKILLEIFKANPQQGITKKDFAEECVKRKQPCVLTDMDSRNIFKEIAVLIEGHWFYKASKKVQELC